MTQITKEKFEIFEKYGGDEDGFARAGQKREKELYQIYEWSLINDFQQRLEMIPKGLTSYDFETQTMADLKKVTDSTTFDLLTKKLRNKKKKRHTTTHIAYGG